MKLKAVIIDDEMSSRQILRNYLGEYCGQVHIAGEAGTVAEGLDLILRVRPQLLFLDVEMPFGNAFDLLDELPERDFETVFVTAYSQYAMEALNQHAAYYLMKPIDIDELIRAVAYVEEVIQKENRLKDRILSSRSPKAEGKITLPQQDGFQVLDVSEILYCKADDNYTEIHLPGRKILVSKTLKYFEEALADFPFVRIHKSFLVNINEVVRYKKGKGGSVLLSNGKELMVSASRKKILLSHYE
ncbi:two component transcriptional regulator, LytTR family [Muriicola jejuensis]|uniref:Response regulator n=1 Tax=Muriicola jejuensis TaxID=504488 RepID=A0A6P0UDY2_9FLAO|nr:LytTR family DNA-binding domain-containing protein [Muriicola jejuensis]NER09473.1 response regulator [Muriicola jejuensis]SMP08341.1 two component transcriptional regulator, LytTR family [Muriicola jejuensis]